MNLRRFQLGLGGLMLTVCACTSPAPVTPGEVWLRMEKALLARDTGAIIVLTDREYRDEMGGVGQLEDDIRQLFAVHGGLRVEFSDQRAESGRLIGYAHVEGRALRFEGPLELRFTDTPQGLMLRSGLLTDLRGITYALRQRRIAVEVGSVERLDAVISMEYVSPNGNREQLFERLRQSFDAARDTALMVGDVSIVVERDRARVIQSYMLISRVAERTIEHRDRERLILRKEGTRWRIIEGLG